MGPKAVRWSSGSLLDSGQSRTLDVRLKTLPVCCPSSCINSQLHMCVGEDFPPEPSVAFIECVQQT